MEHTTDNKIWAGGRLLLGLARNFKSWLSLKLTALALPKVLVSILTWGVLLSLGALLLGTLVFVGIFLAAHEQSVRNSKRRVIVDASEYESLQAQARAEGQLGEWMHLAMMEEELEDHATPRWPS